MAAEMSETRKSHLAVRGYDIVMHAQNGSRVVTVAADGTVKIKGGAALFRLSSELTAEVISARDAFVAGKGEELRVSGGETVPAGWTFERTVPSINDATPGYDLYLRWTPGSDAINVWFGAADITR